MATGITSGERSPRSAIIAIEKRTDSAVLPPKGAAVGLTYTNKMSRADVLQSRATEFAVMGSDGDTDACEEIQANALVACENSNGLAKLMETQAGNVKLIYTDPPYGTGFGFNSRSLEHAYDDHHDEARYVEFIRRRLILCRELLSEDGSIYLHIGHQMVAELKMVMDEVFGRSNFRNLIARRKCSSKNSTRKSFPNLLDFVLFYSKTKNYEFNQPTEEPSVEWLSREYPKEDAKGRYKLVPIHAPGVRNGATGTEWRGMFPPPGKHWQYTPEKLDELDEKGEMHWSRNGNPRRKVYLKHGKGIPLTDYWSGYRDAHHQSVAISGYPTEKNLSMVKKIVTAASSADDLVLDPFCGSGTTLHAADDLDRRWIGMDQSLTAVEATMTRFARGLSKMGDYVPTSKVSERDLFGTPARKFQLVVDSEFLREHRNELNRIASITPARP